MQIKPTIVTVLDTRRIKKTDRYPVKLRVTFLKEQKYYPIGYDMQEDEYEAINSDIKFKQLPLKKRKILQDIKIKCDAQVVKAIDVLNKLPVFSFDLFERKFLTGHHSNDSVYLYYERLIEKLKSERRIGTATSYNSSLNSLKKFSPKLLFRDVTVQFLNDYENWLLSKGRSSTTVGIYLRPLRAVLNQAIEDGEFLRELYPFGKRRYQIPASKNIKKALSLEEIGRIVNFQTESGTWWEKARDMFVFSYFGNGINMKDILRLKYANIDGEFIRFTRAKTCRTNKANSIPIVFHLTAELEDIIKRIGNPISIPENYIFPVLNNDMTPEKEMADVQQFTKMINKYLKKIADEVGIVKHVTTYFARHSFATVLKKNGVSPLYISESLGHTNLKTTENYLGAFEDETKKNMSDLLRKF
jgi:integrase/recombinase XerD